MGAQRAAGFSTELFRGLLESAPDAMVIVDPEGQIILVNRQTERLFGYAHDELVGQPIEVLVPEHFWTRAMGDRDHYVAQPKVRRMGADLGLTARRKDGSELPVEISLSPLTTPSGILVLVSAAFRDVTDRSRAEQAVRDALEREREAATRLREIDALKDEFLATVSHEMRTPLAAIVGFTEVILRRWDAGPGPEARSLLEKVAENAHEMDEMIEQLLDFSVLQAGRFTLEADALGLHSLIEGAVRRLASALAAHRLEIDVSPDLTVVADPAAVGHVLRNLLTNAAKYSAPGTTITVRAHADQEEGTAVVAVSDEGMGIPAEEQAGIFDRFVRGSNVVSDHRGTGVGLGIAKRYVEIQGGHIGVESRVGEGSTFWFTLPWAAAERVPAP